MYVHAAMPANQEQSHWPRLHCGIGPGSPRRALFLHCRCMPVDRPPLTLLCTPRPGCAPSAPAGSMGFTKQQNPEASVALPHAVLEHELFKRCFEQVAVSRISGERPSVEVYALCKGSCNIAAAPRAFGRCEDTRHWDGKRGDDAAFRSDISAWLCHNRLATLLGCLLYAVQVALASELPSSSADA